MQGPVFEPAQLARLRLANRVVLSPMSRMQAADDGTPTADMAAYYAHYASAGAGLVITEATYVDGLASRAYFNQPGMVSGAHAKAWARVADAVHAAGKPILLQLQHGGRLAEPGLHACALGPTGTPAQGKSWQTGRDYATAPLRAASATEIDAIVQSFGTAAERAREAGFDGVEIHGARGYLLDGFLSDPAIGDLAARLQVPLAVVGAVRRAFPQGVLSFNFSLYKMDDGRYQPAGGRADVEVTARALAQAGVDAIHVTTRRALRTEPWGETLAATVRQAVQCPVVIANGGMASLEDCVATLQQTGAEFVALARALLANPDWFRRIASGEPLAAYAPGMEREPLLRPVRSR